MKKMVSLFVAMLFSCSVAVGAFGQENPAATKEPVQVQEKKAEPSKSKKSSKKKTTKKKTKKAPKKKKTEEKTQQQ